MTLTKNDLVDAVTKMGFTKKKSAEIVETCLELIKKTLATGEDVLISGFCKFCVKEKKQRKGRNPQTGEDIVLSERKVVTFNSSPVLREKINRGT